MEPNSARAYLSASFDDGDDFQVVRKDLNAAFGEIDYETESLFSFSGLLPVDLTARKIIRILSFRRPMGREELVDMRKRCLQIETKRQRDGRPMVDLEAGYVTDYNVIRSMLEDDFHRIYLFGGIYAEVLYFHEKMSFRPFPHTPDFYKKQDSITIFNDLRFIMKNESL